MTDICQRCYAHSERLYELGQKNEDDELIMKKVCWDCDFDVCNGGDMFEDPSDIYMDRKEQAYAYDPINEERPW